ncbi:Uncharacterized protein OBRU01_07639, partial [Operophtera brumata]
LSDVNSNPHRALIQYVRNGATYEFCGIWHQAHTVSDLWNPFRIALFRLIEGVTKIPGFLHYASANSYDVRGRLASQPKLWSSPSGFGARAYFRAAASPAVLFVDSVLSSDAGVYRCRVDFKNSPTRNLRVNFTVITPPNRPSIMDAKTRSHTRLLEPYKEGDTLELVCEVYGGDPRPKVIWYLENTVIDDSYEQRTDGVTLNTLTFPNVGRQHLHVRLVCQASNTNLAPPETNVLILDINLRPLGVHILNKRVQLSADRTYDIECRTIGSRPEAYLS